MLAEGVKKLTESENWRKLEPEEVSELLRGDPKPKHVRVEKNVAQKDTGLKKDDEVMNRNIAITPKKK